MTWFLCLEMVLHLVKQFLFFCPFASDLLTPRKTVPHSIMAPQHVGGMELCNGCPFIQKHSLHSQPHSFLLKYHPFKRASVVLCLRNLPNVSYKLDPRKERLCYTPPYLQHLRQHWESTKPSEIYEQMKTVACRIPLCIGDVCQDLQWVPETSDTVHLYLLYSKNMPLMKLNP